MVIVFLHFYFSFYIVVSIVSVSLTWNNHLVDKSNDHNMNSLLLWNIIAGKTVVGQPWPRPARWPSPQARRLRRVWNVLHDACSQAMHQKRSRDATTHDSGEHCITRKTPEGYSIFSKRWYYKTPFPRVSWEVSQSRTIRDAASGTIPVVWSCNINIISKMIKNSKSLSWCAQLMRYREQPCMISLESSFWKWWIEKLLEIWVWRGLGASDFGSSARQRSHIRSGHGREENHTWHSSRLHNSSAPHTWLRSRKDARLRKASELAHFSFWHTKRHYDWF